MAAGPADGADLYRQLRGRRECGHLAAFIAWLGGVSLLLLSIVVETPKDEKL